jgi:hypothetical protein
MNEQQFGTSILKVNEQMIQSIVSTKTWTKFLSIMGFITAGFVIIVGIIFMIFGGAIFSKEAEAPYAVLIGIAYILMSLLYIIPSRYLFMYSSALSRFLGAKSELELESALSYQKSFWKFWGILFLVGIIIGIIGIFAAITIPLLLGIGFKS